MSAKDTTPDVFDNQVNLQKAVDLAKRKWSYNYGDYLTVLKAVGKVDKEETKIPQDLVVLLKNAILEETKEIVRKQEEKVANGEPF